MWALLTIIFLVMACVSFVAFGIHAASGNSHKMAFAFVVVLFWIVMAFWSAGAFGP